MTTLPNLNILERLNASDAYQLLERRRIELVQVLGAVESAYRRSLLKRALKRVEGHMAALGFM
jgi:hypothetical protein